MAATTPAGRWRPRSHWHRVEVRAEGVVGDAGGRLGVVAQVVDRGCNLEALVRVTGEPTSVTIERPVCRLRLEDLASRMATDRCAGEKRDQGPSSKASRAARMARPDLGLVAPGPTRMSSSVAGLKTCRGAPVPVSRTPPIVARARRRAVVPRRFRHITEPPFHESMRMIPRRRAPAVAAGGVVNATGEMRGGEP